MAYECRVCFGYYYPMRWREHTQDVYHRQVVADKAARRRRAYRRRKREGTILRVH